MVISGKVMDVINVSDTITNIVIKIKHNDAYYPVCFTAFGEIKALICQIRVEKNDIVKIAYYIKSNKYNEKYYTSAVIEKISINEKWSRQYSIGMSEEEIRNLNS